MMFAGLIDVQDRMFWNRSYTTGHKSFRARSTITLGRAIGWDNAHHVLYAGVPDHRRRSALVLALRVRLPDHDVSPRGRAARLIAQRDPDLDP